MYITHIINYKNKNRGNRKERKQNKNLGKQKKNLQWTTELKKLCINNEETIYYKGAYNKLIFIYLCF